MIPELNLKNKEPVMEDLKAGSWQQSKQVQSPEEEFLVCQKCIKALENSKRVSGVT